MVVVLRRHFICRPISVDLARIIVYPSGLGDAAGDGGQGVAVPAQGDGISDGVFKAGAFEEGGDRLRHRLPAAFVEAVGWVDIIQGPA